MSAVMDRPFSHRFNRDGTIDSICHCCFRTIGTVTLEADLEALETRHVCNPADVLRLNLLAEESMLH